MDEEIPDYGQGDRIGQDTFEDLGAHCIVFKWNGLGCVRARERESESERVRESESGNERERAREKESERG